MSRTQDKKSREVKKSKILDEARLVFYRKGYLDVTMQDIVDACGISRGGIYLYFSSVDEIFKETAARRNKEKFSIIRNAVCNNEPFFNVLHDYLELQKKRLLNMDNSLLRAMYEYIFSRAGGATKKFRDSQLEYLRKSVSSILKLGVSQNVIRDEGIQKLSDHFVVVIEGLSVLALSDVLTDQLIDEQFSLLFMIIEKMRM